MATSVTTNTAVSPAPRVTGMFGAGVLVILYGCSMLIDVAAASLGFPDVPFDFGPPLPQNWFPSALLGISVLGTGVIAASCARSNKPWTALIALVLATMAIYEIVLLDRVYVEHGRPALAVRHGPESGGSLQQRLDRIYSGTLRINTASKSF